MAPTSLTVRQVSGTYQDYHSDDNTFGNWRDVNNIQAYIVEGWGEGFMFGALMVMAVITVVNMRKGVLLHKMILLEVGL